MKVFFQYCLVGHVVATAFIFGEPMVRHPQLTEIVDKFRTKRVTLNIELGGQDNAKKEVTPRLAIKDIVLDLKDTITNKSKRKSQGDEDWEFVDMPGKHGINPDVSGGLGTLDVIQQGQFVSTQGLEHVDAQKGTWELVWLKDAHAGSLNLGFDIPQDYTRNTESNSAATLPKGTVYVNFMVWSKKSLAFARDAKEKAFQRAKECLEERNEEISKMNGTSNPFMKALHYRNAYAAVETYSLYPLKEYQETIPNEDETIIFQDEDVIVNARGRVWTKELPRGPQYTLGTAKLTLATAMP